MNFPHVYRKKRLENKELPFVLLTNITIKLVT